MRQQTQKKGIVELIKKLLFLDLLRGLATTQKHQWFTRETVEYPKERPHIKDRFRGRLKVDIPKCIACRQCEWACPTDCITVVMDDSIKEPTPKIFDINYEHCMFCGLCVDPCPTGAISHHDEFELATYSKKDQRNDLEQIQMDWDVPYYER